MRELTGRVEGDGEDQSSVVERTKERKNEKTEKSRKERGGKGEKYLNPDHQRAKEPTVQPP